MIDFYSHIGRYYILAHLDTDPFLRTAYEAKWSILPNIGLDVIGTMMMNIFPPLVVAKILVVSIFAIQYYGVISFNRALLGSPPSPLIGVLVAPVLYSFIFGWGFGNFLLGLGLVFWGGTWWLKQRHRPWLATSVACLIAAAIFLTHGVAFALYGLLLGSIEIGFFLTSEKRSVRDLGCSMAQLAVQAVAPVLLFAASATSKSPDGITNADEALSRLAQAGELAARLQELLIYRLATITRVSESPSPPLDVALLAVTIGILAALAAKQRLTIPTVAWPAIAIASLLALLTPPGLFGVGYIADRMPLFLAFVLIASLFFRLQGQALDRVCVSALVVVAVLKVGWMAISWQVYRDEIADYRAISRSIPEHATVAYVNFANLDRLSGEPRCQMYGPLMIPLSKTATSTFAYASQQPIAIRGRLEGATRALRDAPPLPKGEARPRQQLDRVMSQKLFDYVLLCRGRFTPVTWDASASVAQQGRFTLLRIPK